METAVAATQYPPKFVVARLITFAGIVLGYACFYLTRNSLTYTAPAMVADASLGVSMTDVRWGCMKSILLLLLVVRNQAINSCWRAGGGGRGIYSSLYGTLLTLNHYY